MLLVRGQGEGSIYPKRDTWTREDGTTVEVVRWMAVVSLDDGRRVTRQAKDKAGARRNLAALQRIKSAGTVDGSRLTLGAYLSTWLVDVQPRLAPATWRKHEQHIRNHLAPALGHVRLSELSVGHCRVYLVRPGTLGAQTLRHHRATLRRALADALRDGLVTRNVAALAEPPKLTATERPVLTADQARTLIEGTTDDRYHALWTLLVTTGLREAEALALTWEDVDLGSQDDHDHPRGSVGGPGDRRLRGGVAGEPGGDEGRGRADRADEPNDRRVRGARVHVHRTLHRVPGVIGEDGKRGKGRWEFRTTKTPKSRRTVFLPAVTVDALRAHRAAQMTAWLAAGKPGDGLMVFTDTKGRPVHGSKLTELLYPILDGLGLPRVRVHDLRHSAATILYANGVPLEAIADMLGHSTTRVTSDLYRHRVEDVQRDAADAMQTALG